MRPCVDWSHHGCQRPLSTYMLGVLHGRVRETGKTRRTEEQSTGTKAPRRMETTLSSSCLSLTVITATGLKSGVLHKGMLLAVAAEVVGIDDGCHGEAAMVRVTVM